MFRIMCLAMVALSVMSSQVLAGGGGAKRDATVRVTNDFPSGVATRVGVILDKDEAALEKIASAANPEKAFTDAGGKFLTPGASTSFSVLAGDQTIAIIKADVATPTILGFGARSVGKGKTISINASTL